MGLGRRAFACLIASLLISAGVWSVPARAQTTPNDPGFEFQWGFPQVAAEEAWATGAGRSAIVGVIDTGIDLGHEDLEGQIASGGRDITNDDGVPQDDNGQGTHVAGIIAAATGNRIGVAGLAHQAKVLPIKVLDDEAKGFHAHLLEGIRFAMEKKVHVMVMDLDEDVIIPDGGFNLEDAIRAAWDAGIVPVINSDHPLTRSGQFSDARALVVGGVTREGTAPNGSPGVGFARWGISAPGGSATGDENDVFSTFFAHSKIGREYGRYRYEAGSIQAAAHVAGAAAVLRGLGQSPEQTVERILSNATDAGPAGPDRTFGAGILHMGRSVRGLAPRSGSTGSGGPTSTPAGSGPGSGGGGTTASQGGAGAGTSPGGNVPARPDGTVPAAGGIGTPAGAEEPAGAGEADMDGTADQAGDIVGGLTANDGSGPIPGRTPMLPVIALLLLVGSAAITWALRHRALDAPPPINSE